MQLVQATWRTTEPAEVTRDWIISELGAPATSADSVYRWNDQRLWGFEQVEGVYDEPHGEYTYTVAIPEACRYLIIGVAVLVAWAVVFGSEPAKRGVAIAATMLFFVLSSSTPIRTPERLTLEEYTVSPIYFASVLLAAAAVGSSSYLDSVPGHLFVVFGVIFLVGMHYAQGSLPIPAQYAPPPRASPGYLQIPIMGLAAPVGAYCLLTLFAVLRLTGLPGAVVILVTVCSALGGTWLYAVACTDMVVKLQRSACAPYDSRLVRVLTSLLYLVLNLISLVLLYIALELLTFGITGHWLALTGGEVTVLYSGIYDQLDQHFAVLPVVPPRVLSVAFMGLLFLPMVAFSAMWVAHLYTQLSAHRHLRRTSAPCETSCEAVSEGIELRCVDSRWPVVYPARFFLRRRDVIVVSDHLFDELSDAQLSAILTHEVYHLRNNDLAVNLLASLASLGAFGGWNAVLAFYDYPRIEAQADDYAVERVGAPALASALRRMEALQHEHRDLPLSDMPLVLGAPRFLGTDIPFDRLQMRYEDSRLGSAIHRLIMPLHGFYELFFGRLLFDEAHRTVDERIARILSDETGERDGA